MVDLAPNNPYGLTLATPVLTAAGCFGYGVEYARAVDLAAVGAIVTRTTTLQPRRVAARPRIVETPAGLLWAGPWPNPGLRAVLERHAPVWATWPTPVILSVAGATPGEFAQLAAALEGVEGVAGLELNLDGLAEHAGPIIAAARAASPLPLLAKLPPLDDEPLLRAARAAAEAGADALTLCGSPRGRLADPRDGTPVAGGLSGPALLPQALLRLAAVATELSLPLIGCGGVADTAAARQMLAAGARAVQFGAALLADPFAAGRVGAELGDDVPMPR